MMFYISLPILLIISFLWALWSLKRELGKTESLQHHVVHHARTPHNNEHSVPRHEKHDGERELESGKEVEL